MSQSIFKSLSILDFFGIFVGIALLVFGMFRISSGTGSVDAYTAHFVRVGWLYLFLAFIILGFFVIKIIYSLKKK